MGTKKESALNPAPMGMIVVAPAPSPAKATRSVPIATTSKAVKKRRVSTRRKSPLTSKGRSCPSASIGESSHDLALVSTSSVAPTLQIPLNPSTGAVPKGRVRRGNSVQLIPAAHIGGNLNSFSPNEQLRYDKLSSKSVYSGKCFHDDTLVQLGIKESVYAYLSSIGWERLLTFQHPAFSELSLEFLSTFEFNLPPKFDVYHPDVIQFRLCGSVFKLSLAEFNLHLGLISEDELSSPEFASAATDFVAPFLEGFYSCWADFSVKKDDHFWKDAHANTLKDPAIRYIHRFIALTISGRKDTSNIVTKTEYFFLWCMRNRVRVNLGYWLAIQFTDVVKKNRALIGAPFITALALSLHVLPDTNHDTLLSFHLHQAAPMEPLNAAVLFRMGMIEKEGDGYKFVTKTNRPSHSALVQFVGRQESHAESSDGVAPQSPVSNHDLQKGLDDLKALLCGYFAFVGYTPPSTRQ